jgi:HEAT repeat protein
VLLELVGLRRIDAKADLLKAADSSQPNVRAAALTALGATVGPQDLNVLISEVVSPKHPEDALVAQTALKAACIRMPEGDACADQLTAAMANAPAATKGTLLEIIGAMGTARSLEALAAAAKSGDSQLADVATKALGEWMNLEAAPVLLDLAKNLTEEKYQVRALKGYMRLARQFVKPNQDGQRVNMCKQAFDAAKRPAEQKLVIETLLRAQTLEALRLAVRAAQKPELKADATRVANTIAQKLGPDKPEVKQLLAKLEPVAAN